MNLLTCLAMVLVTNIPRTVTDFDVRAALAMAIATQGMPHVEPTPTPKPDCPCSSACVCGCNEGQPCTCKVMPDTSTMLAQNMTCVNGKCYPTSSISSFTQPTIQAAPATTYRYITPSYQPSYQPTYYTPSYGNQGYPVYRYVQPVQPAFYQRTYYIR